MAVFKCKMCGGTIEPRDNGIGVCDSCGIKQTIPNTNDEKKMNLLDRANHFRMQNDFDKAMGIYEQILDGDTTDSDIYYSLALCRYGITYVDDPKTNKKIPTINRMQNTRFTEDTDFLMAVKNAEPEQVKLYNEEGEYIDKVQQGIMDITKNEKPYDVFICYKETDDNGERTHDSVLANDLYHGLTNEGFKVFFSRITLEGKLGIAYEPYIFAALQSSKVMVVIGTKKEYLNAPWVKNEWSRYLRLINEGANKTLIPAYKDMDPYDLPDEFSNLQALDMSKLGFMQDLIRGIKKIASGTKETTTKDNAGGSGERVASLLKRVKMFLEDGDFEKADEYCEKALDIDAEDSNIYLYKLLVENECASVDDLKDVRIDLNENLNFNKAMRFADEKQKQVLNNLKNEILYRDASECWDNMEYGKAVEKYSKIMDYNGAQEKIYDRAITLLNDGNYKHALDIFNKLIDYKDSKEIVEKCKRDIYNAAVTDMENGYYKKAKEEFGIIMDYNDAKEKMAECEKGMEYDRGIYYMGCGNYYLAESFFKRNVDYKDSKQKILEIEEMYKKESEKDEAIEKENKKQKTIRIGVLLSVIVLLWIIFSITGVIKIGQ